MKNLSRINSMVRDERIDNVLKKMGGDFLLPSSDGECVAIQRPDWEKPVYLYPLRQTIREMVTKLNA